MAGTTPIAHNVLEQITRVLSPDDFVRRITMDFVSPFVRGIFNWPLPTPTNRTTVIYNPLTTLAESRVTTVLPSTSQLCVAPEPVRFEAVGRTLEDYPHKGYYVEVTLSRELDATGVPIPFASRQTYEAAAEGPPGTLTFTSAPPATTEVSPFGTPVQGLDLLVAGTWRITIDPYFGV